MATITTATGTHDLSAIDQMIRDQGVPRHEIAARLGVSATRLYDTLLRDSGVRVVTVSFLMDDRTGKPLYPVRRADIAVACEAARTRRRSRPPLVMPEEVAEV